MSKFLEHIGFLEVFSVGIVALLGWALIPKETKKSALSLDFDHAMPIATVHRNWFVLGGLVFDPDD